MNSELPVYYQESNKINVSKLAIAYIFCFFVAIVLGYVYTMAIVVIPLVYVRGLIPVLVAVLLGFIVRFLGRMTHSRNLKSRYLLIVGLVLFLTYFQWVAFILFFYNERMPSFNFYFTNLGMIFSPQDLLASVVEINAFGIWEVFGIVLNKGLLSLIWISEVVIFLVIPILNIKHTRAYPYSEEQEKWYKKYTLEEEYKVVGSIEQLITDLNKDALKTIQSLGYGTGSRYTKIHVFYMERSTYHYLDVEKVLIDREGKDEHSLLVEGLRIDNKTAKSLLDNLKHKQDRIVII
jgi:hypothetical protein